jgi:hypothetical protein
MYKTVYTEVEVDVDLSDFETNDLIEELEERGELPSRTGPYDSKELVEQIWMRRRNGQDYNYPLDQLIYAVTGRII